MGCSVGGSVCVLCVNPCMLCVVLCVVYGVTYGALVYVACCMRIDMLCAVCIV